MAAEGRAGKRNERHPPILQEVEFEGTDEAPRLDRLQRHGRKLLPASKVLLELLHRGLKTRFRFVSPFVVPQSVEDVAGHAQHQARQHEDDGDDAEKLDQGQTSVGSSAKGLRHLPV